MWGKINNDVSKMVRVDSSTHCLQTLENEHHEIHDASSYTAEHNASGGSGTKATLSFTTPNTNKAIHLLVHLRSNVEAFFTLGEGATVTAASGSDYVCKNRNRRSSNTSVLSPAGSTGTIGNITRGATVTNFGIALETLHFGNGKSGDDTRGDTEWILAANTVYALEIESEATSSEVEVEMNWYEHIAKDDNTE